MIAWKDSFWRREESKYCSVLIKRNLFIYRTAVAALVAHSAVCCYKVVINRGLISVDGILFPKYCFLACFWQVFHFAIFAQLTGRTLISPDLSSHLEIVGNFLVLTVIAASRTRL